MSKLRVGVVGLGMGRNHVRGFQAHAGADVVAVADPQADRLAEIGVVLEDRADGTTWRQE